MNSSGVGVVTASETVYVTGAFMQPASQPAASEPAPASIIVTGVRAVIHLGAQIKLLIRVP